MTVSDTTLSVFFRQTADTETESLTLHRTHTHLFSPVRRMCCVWSNRTEVLPAFSEVNDCRVQRRSDANCFFHVLSVRLLLCSVLRFALRRFFLIKFFLLRWKDESKTQHSFCQTLKMLADQLFRLDEFSFVLCRSCWLWLASVSSTLCLTELLVASPDALMRKCRQQAPQAAAAIVITPVEQQRKKATNLAVLVVADVKLEKYDFLFDNSQPGHF